MKTILAFLILLLGFTSLFAQSNKRDTIVIAPVSPPPPAPDSNRVHSLAEKMPKFDGDMNRWLADHIVYPKKAEDAAIQGTVYVSFVVEKDGSVSTIKILRGVDPSLDNEALRVISVMPKWIPGTQFGKPVRVQYSLPIHFKL
jgi:periplasmic protein TonB